MLKNFMKQRRYITAQMVIIINSNNTKIFLVSYESALVKIKYSIIIHNINSIIILEA